MAEAPILQSGDLVHFVMPSSGDLERDTRVVQDMRAEYARLGITVFIASAISNLPKFEIVAVIRKPLLIPKED